MLPGVNILVSHPWGLYPLEIEKLGLLYYLFPSPLETEKQSNIQELLVTF
jgi:hypothetical protein